MHEYGHNFALFGIVEHPIAIIQHRFRWNNPKEVIDAEFRAHMPLREWWTDGSVFWNINFWLTAGGFAIVNEEANVSFSGPVRNLSISYTTELRALVAICKANAPTKVFTDCKTIVDQFQFVKNGGAEKTWSHYS